MDSIKLFAPATIANVSCGFDALGLALDGKGDEMIFTKRSDNQLVITKIEGADLPYDIDKNLVGTVIKAMLKEQSLDIGFDIEIYKGFKPGSGLKSFLKDMKKLQSDRTFKLWEYQVSHSQLLVRQET